MPLARFFQYMTAIYGRHNIPCYHPDDEPASARLDDMRERFGIARKADAEERPMTTLAELRARHIDSGVQ